MTKIKRLTEKKRNGIIRYYWEPSKTLREAGYKTVSLGKDRDIAITKAMAYNNECDTAKPLPKEMIIGTENLEYVIIQYLQSPEYQELASSTRLQYRKLLETIRLHFGSLAVNEITTSGCKAYYNHLKTTSLSGAGYTMRVLSVLFSWAMSNEMASGNPVKPIKIKNPPPRKMIFTEHEITKAINTADQMGAEWLGDMIVIAYNTLQRRGDVTNMKWFDYNLDTDTIKVVQQKTKRTINIPVLPELKHRLMKMRERGTTSPYMITIGKSTPISEATFKRYWDKVRKKAGIEHLKFHDLRGTGITRLADAECEIAEIASWSGHTLQGVHQILEHYLVTTNRQAQNAYDKIINAEGL